MNTVPVNYTVDTLLSAVDTRPLTHEEAVFLLQTKNSSRDFYKILEKSNQLTRSEYDNKAYIFSQIGLNARPCSGNCKFCSMAAERYMLDATFEKTHADIGQLREQVTGLVEAGTHDIFLMTTADYPLAEILAIGRDIRACIPDAVRLVVNIGDFDLATAHVLRETGFTGAYHIHRLREGIDTALSPELRLRTLDNIVAAGLELYYCIEPIGPEHTYDEIADEMIRARELHVAAMAVMRRTPVPGTYFADKGQISAMELTKIAAVTRLVSRPTRSMNAHEIIPMSLLAGVNQLYAEAGANPRDSVHETSHGRGYSVRAVKNLLLDAEFTLA